MRFTMSREQRLMRVDEDILATTRSLFPGAEITLGHAAMGKAAFRLVPGLRHTHMLVPADSPSAAGDAVDRPSAKDTRRQILRRRAVGAVLRNPTLARVLMPDVLQIGPTSGTLLDYLEHVVQDEVRVSMALGARRANRKPVLSVHRRDGRQVGYAKVGLTPLANDLIDHEARTLRSLSAGPAPRHFRAPAVIHHGGWGSSRVLLMETLRPSAPRRSRDLPLGAMAELAGRDGVVWEPLGESAWIRAITVDAGQLRSAGHPELLEIVARYARAFGGMTAPLGGWHGDLGSWNMAWEGDTAFIWDWERAQDRVPVGIDAVHFTCHASLRDTGNLARARDVLTDASTRAIRSVLARLGIDRSDAHVDRAVLLGYLLSMTARFSVDAVRPDGEVVSDLARWYLTVLSDQLDQEERMPWS